MQSDNDADYEDGNPLGWFGVLDRLLTGDTLTTYLFLTMLAGCCVVAPFAAFVGGLGLLICRTREARDNSTFLLVGAAWHGLILWLVVLKVVI